MALAFTKPGSTRARPSCEYLRGNQCCHLLTEFIRIPVNAPTRSGA